MALELLAEVVDDLGLARAAVGRMLVDEPAVDDVAQDTLVSTATSIVSREAAQSLVARLPERYRHAVVLRDVERLSYREVAERMGLNVNTVKSHVARGRAVMARALESGRAP